MVVKSAAAIAKKWVTVSSNSVEFYEEGVRSPLNDWEKETVAAEPRYEAGIKSAMNRKAFSKGVKKAGTSKQQKATIEKGIDRWPVGIRAAEEDMRIGMEPVVTTLEGIKLPERFETGDPRNIKRVEAVTTALHKMKIS